jgi:hypothetical protein
LRVILARIGPRFSADSRLDRRDHGLDAKDVERPSQIVDERREAEFGAHIVEASHQEGALVHPLLDAAEGMLDDLATPIENLGPRLQGSRLKNETTMNAVNPLSERSASAKRFLSAASHCASKRPIWLGDAADP